MPCGYAQRACARCALPDDMRAVKRLSVFEKLGQPSQVIDCERPRDGHYDGQTLNMFASHDLKIEADTSANRMKDRRRGCASRLLPNKELVCSCGCLQQRIGHS